MSELIRNFTNDFAELVYEYGDKTAIIAERDLEEVSITYKQVAAYVDRFLTFFEAKGLRPGDTILSLLPNSSEALLCYLATIKGGYGYAPLPCNATTAEVKRWIELVEPKLCMKKLDIDFPMLDESMGGTQHVANIICDNRFAFLPAPNIKHAFGDSPRLYLSTSGTTGVPKAMVLDSNIVWSSGCAFSNFHSLHGKSVRFWNYLPMSYLGGLFNLGLIPLCSGGSLLITEPFSGKTFLHFWQTIKKYDINSLWLVPTIIRGLLSIAKSICVDKNKLQQPQIKKCFVGTAPISLKDKKEFKDFFGITALENFALSETTFFTTETPENILSQEEGSVGQILPYVEVKFSKKNEEDTFYEIKVKSPFLFSGYLNQDGNIELPVDESGFFSTGDMGYMNKNNIVVITGRRQEIIKKGGLFVALKEIETLVAQLDNVQEVAAVKVNHDFYGESYVLYVVPAELNDSIKNSIALWLHNNLVSYKWPEDIIICDSFPKTASGKIKKGLLGEKYGDC